MTDKLYYKDSHLFSFKATVLSCEAAKDKYSVILDRTAFFPEGGGQSADTGSLGNVKVLDVQETNGVIYHLTNAPLQVGEIVDGTLNAEERFRKMQNHSGEHIVSGIVHKLYGYDNVGFHLGEKDVTVDYNGELTRDQLDEIEILSNKAVYDNLTITTTFPTDEERRDMNYRSKLELTENVRIVTIGDVDCCACCAPHVNVTGEIGAIKILDFERYKGGIRLHMLCGAEAMEDYRIKYANIQKISNLICVPQVETAEAVEKLQSSLKEKDYEVHALREALAKTALTNAKAGQRSICFLANPLCDMDSLRSAVNQGMQNTEICAGFIPAENGFRYCIGSNTVDLRKETKTINAAISGRGGGQPSMIQGSATADWDTIQKYFIEL